MRYPGAEWKPIGVNHRDGGCDPRFIVLHIMQGTLAGTDSWFHNPAAQVSAHFGVGKSGKVIQWVDTNDTAWHAAAANSMSIGVEHEGMAGESLTAAQLEADAKLCAWAHKAHGIPLVLMNETGGSGLAWHGLGGNAWGGHPDCPGSPVIAQRPVILKAAEGIVNPVQDPEKDWRADGKTSLTALCGAHAGWTPSGVLRRTAVHHGKFEPDVAAWLNGVFEGRIPVTSPVPAGAVLRVPA